MALTRKQSYLAGKDRRNKLPANNPANWDIFSRTSEFKQFSERHQLTPEQIEAYRKGFCDEVL